MSGLRADINRGHFYFTWWIRYYVAATAAKSLQSPPTLCDPIDGSPSGSAVPGILQARTLEWVAISFSNAWKWKVKVKSLSRARLLATPWTVAYQASPSMGFSRQEYWSGLSLPSLDTMLLDTYSSWTYFILWNLMESRKLQPTRTNIFKRRGNDRNNVWWLITDLAYQITRNLNPVWEKSHSQGITTVEPQKNASRIQGRKYLWR